MNPVDNPFAPGPGFPPPLLVGRDEILQKYEVLLTKVSRGLPAAPVFMYGLRGVGKTVLLVQIDKIAKNLGFLVERFEVDEQTELNFRQAIFNRLKSILLKLDTLENLKQKFHRALSILKAIAMNYEGVEFSLDVDKVLGEADSKNFQDDLMLMLSQVGEVAKEKGKPVCLLIDELQNLNKQDLAALLAGIHRLIQDQLPVIIIGAGLPSLLSTLAEAKSYSERMDTLLVGPLRLDFAKNAIEKPFIQRSIEVKEGALDEVIQMTSGYPYFLQQFGEVIWDEASQPIIDKETVSLAIPKAIQKLDQGFFKARYDRSTEEEKRFMHCMATQTSSPYDTSEIAFCLGKSAQHVGQYRNKLISKGFIYPIGHGKIDFTVPLFDDFLKRQ